MHELSIAMALVRQLEEVCAREKGMGVSSVSLLVGDLSGVDPDALAFAFPSACEGTVCQGAHLLIERIPAHARCLDCEAECVPRFAIRVCERCGSRKVKLDKGQELLLQSVVVRDAARTDHAGGDHVS